MIASLTGTVLQVGPTSAVIEVGGLGVLALCSPGTVAGLRVGQRATLATSLVVREDSLTLYGFATVDEREFFELLLTATGVGPKLAQAALAVLPPDQLRAAIASENLVQLIKVPGVGRKGAQRMVLELKDKVGAAGAPPPPPPHPGWRATLVDALAGLGWPQAQADDTVARVAAAHPEAGDADVPDLLREALGMLTRSR